MRGVPPGTAQVRALHSAYTQGLVSGVEVDPARGPAEVRIVLTQGGRIEGRVRSRDGSLPRGRVRDRALDAPGRALVHSDRPEPAAGRGGWDVRPRARSRRAGRA